MNTQKHKIIDEQTWIQQFEALYQKENSQIKEHIVEKQVTITEGKTQEPTGAITGTQAEEVTRKLYREQRII